MPASKTVFGLTKEQLDMLQEVLDLNRGLNVSSPSGDYDPDDRQTPDVYIVKTPVDGIPGLSIIGTGTGTDVNPQAGDTAGSADCDLYRINASGVMELLDLPAKTVYNMTRAAIPGDIFILAERDKWGTWIAQTQGLHLVRGMITDDLEPGGSATLFIYEGPFGSETATQRSVENVYNNTSCTIKGGVINSAVQTPDNGQYQFIIYKSA